MTTQNASQLREQALALLRIEREQMLEQFDPESDRKIGPAAIHGQSAGSETRRSSGKGRLIAIQRTAC